MPHEEPAPLGAALADARAALSAAGIADPAVDVELLAAHLLGTSRGGVQAAVFRGDVLADGMDDALRSLVARRAAREPLQHITGAAYFRHLELEVGPGVFVPRPETEMVAQLAIDALWALPDPRPIVADLGTGSGAIALAIATEVPHAEVHAVERSDEAIAWTRRNVQRTGAANIRLVHGDLADALPELDGTLAVLVSNPPYVPDEAIPRDPEVRLHDPVAALYGGPDGLDVVRVIDRVGMRLLRPGGTLVIEHGEWQGEPIRELLSASGWRRPATHPDLTMRDRATTALRP
jgi:release factor glutamine methyltransferase